MRNKFDVANGAHEGDQEVKSPVRQKGNILKGPKVSARKPPLPKPPSLVQDRRSRASIEKNSLSRSNMLSYSSDNEDDSLRRGRSVTFALSESSMQRRSRSVGRSPSPVPIIRKRAPWNSSTSSPLQQRPMSVTTSERKVNGWQSGELSTKQFRYSIRKELFNLK